MLKPVFFPFTHLGDRAAAALRAHFDSILLLRPFTEELPPGMQDLERRGFIELLAPLQGDEANGAAAVGPFLEWARRHAGGAGPTEAFWQAQLAGDALGGERSAFELASQIKRRPPPEPSRPAADPLLAARVFLRLAQELDRQEDELFCDLVRHQRRSAELMEALVGRPGPQQSGRSPAATLSPTGREEHRLPERLCAWAQLFQARACPSPVLATTSAAAVTLLVEGSRAARRLPVPARRRQRAPAATEISEEPAARLIDEVAGWVSAIRDRIEVLPIAGPVEDGVAEQGDLLITLFPDEPPCRLLSRFAALPSKAETTTPNAHPGEHTVVILFSCRSDALQDTER
ncbi:MAG: hypothetical protein R6V84_13910 [Desulfobacterales bacterium]